MLERKKGQSEGATHVILNFFQGHFEKSKENQIKLMLIIYLIQQIQILSWQHGITKIVSELFYVFIIVGLESNEYLLLIAHLQVPRSYTW